MMCNHITDKCMAVAVVGGYLVFLIYHFTSANDSQQ